MRNLLPLILFLLGLAAIYVGTVQAAFSALMRLPLRLGAERSDTSPTLSAYLDEPRLLFIPARLLLGLVLVLACELATILFGVGTWRSVAVLAISLVGFVFLCEHFVPQLIVRSNPQAIVEFLVPSFRIVASPLQPLTLLLLRLVRRREPAGPDANGVPERANGVAQNESSTNGDDGDERRLLQSIVDFGDILVREVMTPRPDIVAIDADATVGELQALAREQQYSRIPVFRETLDNIVGFISIKDLILLPDTAPSQPITPLVRPAYFVPETKRVPELLQEFQRKRVQAAIVVDEYGGTAGLVTLEDLLEEIVGEIRDEYDIEAEPVLQEEDGSFVFSGRTHIRELAERLKVDIEEGEGYETVGGYLLAHVGRVPVAGETFEIDGLSVEVLEAERRRVTRVRVRRRQNVPVSVPEPTE